MAEEEVAVNASPVASDHKRKLEDLEPDTPNPPTDDTLTVEETRTFDLNENSEGDQNGGESVPEVENEHSDAPDVKRPRIEEEKIEDEKQEKEEADDSVPAPDNGNELRKSETNEVQNSEANQVQDSEDNQEQKLGTDQVQNSEDNQEQKLEVPPTVNAQQPPAMDLPESTEGISQQGNIPSTEQQPALEPQMVTRKFEVPNTKVGVLIGKSGDTIRFLQYNSGAKIQITRDTEADPYSSTRAVELIGALENVNKAEQLIKDVIAEADAGGSPALVARGFGTAQSGAEQIEIQVPNEKVGMIIGKGGETIKNLQTRSGARIQLIPQHLPEGDISKERTVRVTGNKKQIEAAREMMKEVMNQPMRSSSLSGGYSQHTFRPRGPTGPSQWAPRGPLPAQQTNYDQQRGPYPSQTTQYPPQTFSNYPPQQAPRGGLNTGWEQRPSVPLQTPPQSGGYDYYGQGGHIGDPQAAAHAPAPISAPVPAPTPAPTQVNYNYGQAQVSDYGQPPTYSQSVPPQQSYGHGYADPKYDNQAPTQSVYGGQHGNSQPGPYPQQVSSQSGYPQQPYSKPAYGMPSQGPPQSYGPPRTSQPGEAPYQGPISSYGSGVPSQQSYPYPTSGQAPQSYPYGPTSDGYVQPSSVTSSAPGYAQQGSQAASGYAAPQGGQVAPVYAQQSGQAAPGYAPPQGAQPIGYGQYPTSQPGYSEQPVPNNTSYGYQGSSDPGYSNNIPTPGYGAPLSGQAGYAQQPPTNQLSYDQSVPQPGYGSVVGSAPVGYGKSLSPQPGYGQYDASQMYGYH